MKFTHCIVLLVIALFTYSCTYSNTLETNIDYITNPCIYLSLKSTDSNKSVEINTETTYSEVISDWGNNGANMQIPDNLILKVKAGEKVNLKIWANKTILNSVLSLHYFDTELNIDKLPFETNFTAPNDNTIYPVMLDGLLLDSSENGGKFKLLLFISVENY